MKKNYYSALLLGSLLTFTSVYTFGQERDSVKTKNIDEVNLTVGSRNKNRVATDTPVPVDVINIAAQGVLSPQTDLNQILNFTAPSFTSNSTTVADGTDHIDPAQLRGLGPDQVLVLLNGKRRHSSSLVNINGSPGRGSVGTDLNAIPAFAIERLEVLRDGASAQYGSDAIAGVINVVMKRNTGQLTAALTAGGFNSSGSNNFEKGWDGAKYQVDLNYGTKLGSNGFINFTGSLLSRDDTRRAMPAGGKIYNAYNAIEKRAMESGVNISSLFSNINPQYNPNANQILSYLRQYQGNVGYFSAEQRTAIQNANTITEMQKALNFDVTENELAYRGLERKDFNMRVGQSKLQSGQFYVNSEFDLTEGIRGYAFGGYSMRKGDAGGFYRRPNQNRTSTSIYLDGFLPEIHSDITDVSIGTGIKGKMGNVNWDLSNTFGKNSFQYSIENTANATMMFPSKTVFDAGELAFSQNTINADFNTQVNWLQGLNLAFGAEGRFENFQIIAGEESSWARYDYLGKLYTTTTQVLPTDFFGSTRPGGAQVFPGYRSENALDKNRTSFAIYSDNELDVTEKWLLSGALRFENFSDFGSTFNYKLATRYKITNDINFRAALSTGFRAPSLHQIYFNSTSTQFVGGVPFEVGIFSNDSKLAGLLGINKLKQERSASYSAGFTAKVPSANLSITLDGYYIKIKDRITLTDQFSPTPTTQALFDQAAATAAAFFANSIDTQTKGIEAVISQKSNFPGFKLNNDFAVTVSKTNRIGDIHSSTILQNSGQASRYFSESSRVYLEEASPRFKMSLNNLAEFNKLSLLMRNVYFGKVTDPNSADIDMNGTINADEHPVWSGKLITDLSASYKFNKVVSLTLGSNNVFDIYPDKNLDSLSNDNQFVYSRNVSQFGMNGRFLFVRANLTF
ncbi:TonB-dependent receptor plug domain-containing protein [Kaistella polysaccharea]|uniref:TonB-dependent receptor plug domain-containing protein n=1 Tax=Kaistella polysaccharea TaxID=2878534 RepID=UPI001CF2E9F6|nr:TonB-dependent receptor [Kaistella polysaccharea]